MNAAKIEKKRPVWLVAIIWVLILGLGVLAQGPACHADDSLCARVKIEINQELTLERQAFDAHMRINNGLTHITLEDVGVTVWFNDADGNAVAASSNPDDTSAQFFIRLDEMTNISDVSGSGTVASSTSADIHWLIIPSPGASNGLESGTLYYVGATLTYTIGGEENTTEVSPDYIYVKPMPELTLDYFLPAEIYGDDTFTDAVEPPVPFTLGVRVKNNGQGTAHDLKIDSAQPKITENEQGLLIGFNIEGSQVNGSAVSDSLLVDFGDIAPNAAGTARWRMTCTLSGKFVDFDADFTHADELGGEITSLIDEINTHFLVADVQVDLTGRDQILDFLAKDEDVYRIFESDSEDTVVSDQSASSTLAYRDVLNGQARYRLATPANPAFLFVQVADPYSGTRAIASVVRSDGKVLKTANAWLSKTRDGQDWNYSFNLFDVAGTGEYTVAFADMTDTADAPVLQHISDVIVVEGTPIGFLVQASDADGTIPALTAAPLPAGAAITDAGDGTGSFAWTPVIGQAGPYTITFRASDGSLEDSQRVQFTIRSVSDTDGDGLDDAWEEQWFGGLDRDGTGDFDGDGISDLDEFLAGSDPTAEDHAPTVPLIASPADGERVVTATPDLIIENSTDADGNTLSYAFELYADGLDGDLIAEAQVDEGTDTTTWQAPATLAENGTYLWRVRATDGYSYSLWTYGGFRVDVLDEVPDVPLIAFPPDGGQVDSTTPLLAVTGATDPDDDELTCAFEVYADEAMTDLVASTEGITPSETGAAGWTVDASLEDGVTYHWHAVVTDSGGLAESMPLATFTVNTVNLAPPAPVIATPADGDEIATTAASLSVQPAIDADGDTVWYYFEIDTDPGFVGANKLASTMIDAPPGDAVAWPVDDLVDNARYHWRVRATDGLASSPWTVGSFFVNTANDSPAVPVLNNPGQSAWAFVLTPQLSLAEGSDADGDALTYRYEVYTDEELTSLVAWTETEATGWTVASGLVDRTTYHWRARATDDEGLAGGWSETGVFYLKQEEQPEPEAIRVSVATDGGAALAGLKVYAFTAAGSYAGLSAVTDDNGTASFDIDAFDAAGYMFRADYLGIQFWSATVAIPDTTAIPIVVDQATVTVTVQSAAGTVAGAPVYLYSAAGSYLGVRLATDANGQVVIDLPTGETFLFRADILGAQYWSPATTVSADTGVAVDAGGGVLIVQVRQDESTPMAGISVYLFDDNEKYLGVNGTTGEEGTVAFTVSEAAYRLRVDYLGYQFWSGAVNVVTDTTETITITHQSSRVSVIGRYQDIDVPITEIRVHLFSPTDSYLGQYRLTDENGQAGFSLPEKEYKVRADYLNTQYWSESFVWDDPQIIVPLADARVNVTGAGLPAQDVTVHVFSADRAYLGLSGTTDAAGQATFRLPEGTYDFRVDYQSSQFWADDRMLAADVLTDVDISVGGGTFTLDVVTDTGTAIAGVKCHVFDADEVYLGLSGTTDEAGRATFDLADGIYRFRVDELGSQFWSSAATVTGDASHTITIDHAAVTVEARSAGSPVPDTKVYLFSSTETYLGIYAITDENGRGVFDLPVGETYRFRSDVLDNHYWSGDVTVAAALDPVVIDAGGGIFQVSVLTDTGSPLAGLKTYLFNVDGKYLGLSGTTDDTGQTGFTVPAGIYQVRTDYLGYAFWSAVIEVSTNADITLTIALSPVTVSVVAGYQAVDTPLAGVPVHLFTPTGQYLGISGETDDSGQVVFNLPEQPYMVRADDTGGQYWSETFTRTDPTLRIPMADAVVSVTGAGLPATAVTVYLFSDDGAYLGSSQTTDAQGQAVFRLPAGTYRFRADHQSKQYWSADVTLAADQENAVLVSVGGGSVVLSLQQSDGTPMAGINTYVFTDDSTYLGLKGSTDENGQTAFDLADGTVRFRADHLGYKYWSDPLTVPDSMAATMTIAHTDVVLALQADYQGTTTPLESRQVYLFHPDGAYLGQSRETDTAGQAVFRLPDQAYQFRCDELGQHYWSEETVSTDTTVTIGQGRAVIHATYQNENAQNARVYLFSGAEVYLGRYTITNSLGEAAFTLPAGDYRFRIDLDGRQTWSDIVTIAPDLETPVAVATE